MKKRILLILLVVLAVAGGGYGAWAKWGVKAEAPKQVAVQKVEAPRSVYTPVPEEPKATVESLFAAVNAERAKVGVPALVLDERLNVSAQRKADDEVKYNYFGHISPNDGRHGYEYMNDVGVSCKVGSENLTNNIYTNSSSQAMRAWINSPKHYATIIEQRYNLTGFGIAGTQIVEHFCQTN